MLVSGLKVLAARAICSGVISGRGGPEFWYSRHGASCEPSGLHQMARHSFKSFFNISWGEEVRSSPMPVVAVSRHCKASRFTSLWAAADPVFNCRSTKACHDLDLFSKWAVLIVSASDWANSAILSREKVSRPGVCALMNSSFSSQWGPIFRMIWGKPTKTGLYPLVRCTVTSHSQRCGAHVRFYAKDMPILGLEYRAKQVRELASTPCPRRRMLSSAGRSSAPLGLLLLFLCRRQRPCPGC